MERRKKKLVLERDFQFRFTLTLCLLGGAIFLIFGSSILFLLKLNYEVFMREALIQMPELAASLKREFRILSLATMLGFIVLIGVLFFSGLRLTNRIVGPMLNLKSRLRDFADGKTGVRMRLRNGDEFQNVQDVFNHAMEMHEIRQKEQQQKLEQMAVVLKEGSANKALGQLQEILAKSF